MKEEDDLPVGGGEFPANSCKLSIFRLMKATDLTYDKAMSNIFSK
jgi:hypothetical protein